MLAFALFSLTFCEMRNNLVVCLLRHHLGVMLRNQFLECFGVVHLEFAEEILDVAWVNSAASMHRVEEGGNEPPCGELMCPSKVHR